MKTQNIFKNPLFLLFATLTILFSCGKESSTTEFEGTGDAKIEITISSVSSKLASSLNNKNATSKSSLNNLNISSADLKQEETIDLGNGLRIKATLIDETLLDQYANAKLAAVPGPQQKVLDPNVRYRVIAYNTNGSYASHKDYVYGQEGSAGEFMLVGGINGAAREYTFVVYSMNSTTILPEITNLETTDLNNVVLNVSPSDGQLLFFKTNFSVAKGNNKLNIILEHFFSQITTTINLVSQPEGYISQIGNPRFLPQANNVNVKFNPSGQNPTTTYIPQGNSTIGSPLVFPSITGTSTRSITSTPTFIAAESTTTGSLAIDELTIYAILEAAPVPYPLPINKAVTIPNVKITPGHRYNLILNYDIPCVEVVTYTESRFAWYTESGSVPTQTLTMPASDFGFSFDIYRLDNSFNIQVNGENIITPGTVETSEVQFESGIAAYPINVQFEDGKLWNGSNGNAPQVYDFHQYYGTGTTAGSLTLNNPLNWNINESIHTPLLKIIIDVEGNPSMWGRKSFADNTFYKIVPIGSAFTINNVTWNQTGTNTVIIDQAAQGASAMFGYGRGYKLILCP